MVRCFPRLRVFGVLAMIVFPSLVMGSGIVPPPPIIAPPPIFPPPPILPPPIIAPPALVPSGLHSATVKIVDKPSARAIVSTFDRDDEGWLVVGDAQDGTEKPTYEAEGGKRGGCISATDDVLGGVWYWQAPAKFLGERSSSYGKYLSFDLTQSATDNPFEDADVVLEGENLKLVYEFHKHPGTEWTSYQVALAPAKGWKRAGTEDEATEEDFREVLRSLKVLRIRGEYRTGADVGRLDNVVLE